MPWVKRELRETKREERERERKKKKKKCRVRAVEKEELLLGPYMEETTSLLRVNTVFTKMTTLFTF